MAEILPAGWPDWGWPFLLMAVGAGVTYAWRALGVALAGRINPNGPMFEWAACVAYALLAGLVARMIVFPVGPLERTDTGSRVFAAILALVVFFLARRNILAGVLAGVTALVLLTLGDAHLT